MTLWFQNYFPLQKLETVCCPKLLQSIPVHILFLIHKSFISTELQFRFVIMQKGMSPPHSPQKQQKSDKTARNSVQKSAPTVTQTPYKTLKVCITSIDQSGMIMKKERMNFWVRMFINFVWNPHDWSNCTCESLTNLIINTKSLISRLCNILQYIAIWSCPF